MDRDKMQQAQGYSTEQVNNSDKVDFNEQSKQDLQAYLDNLLEDVFSQLPGS